MVLMALDHARWFFSNADYSPTNLNQASSILFLTRWVTHFCAPTFIFLSGSAAFFYGHDSRQHLDRKKLSQFLITRGLWLILLELTVISFAWKYSIIHPDFGVIWAIGLSMVVFSIMLWLPFKALATLALVIIFGHNLFDPGNSLDFLISNIKDHPLWIIIYGNTHLIILEKKIGFVSYTLIPWVGVLALGYMAAPLIAEPFRKRKALLRYGLVAIATFILIRGFNLYGDPSSWKDLGQGPWRNFLAILNTNKYPPSLSFLLMILGPMSVFLCYCDRINIFLKNIFLIFGRVPLFFYIIHIFFIHGLYDLTVNLLSLPSHWGVGLGGVYLVWIITLIILYWPSRWFMMLKKRHKKWWLRYL